MRTIYELDVRGIWTGNARDITDKQGRPQGWVQSEVAPQITGAQVAQWQNGWTVLDEYPPLPPAPVIIPAVVTMAQARKALILGGISIASVNTAIDGIVDATERELAQTDWEYSAAVRRDSALVTSLGPILDLTDEQIDDLFVLADTL
jgi:hypothetical protein